MWRIRKGFAFGNLWKNASEPLVKMSHMDDKLGFLVFLIDCTDLSDKVVGKKK